MRCSKASRSSDGRKSRRRQLSRLEARIIPGHVRYIRARDRGVAERVEHCRLLDEYIQPLQSQLITSSLISYQHLHNDTLPLNRSKAPIAEEWTGFIASPHPPSRLSPIKRGKEYPIVGSQVVACTRCWHEKDFLSFSTLLAS